MWRATLERTLITQQTSHEVRLRAMAQLGEESDQRMGAMLTQRDETIRTLEAEREDLATQYADVWAEVRALKPQLATAEARIELQAATILSFTRESALRAELEAKMPAARSKLTDAIREQARQPDGRIDPRLVAHFRGEANKLLRQNKDVDEVIEMLGEWQTTETTDQPTVERIVASFNDSSL